MSDRFLEEQREIGLLRKNQATGIVELGGENLPLDFPLVAGDCIFSFRSALDCCWSGLHRSLDRRSGKTTLPRGKVRQEVSGTLKNNSVEKGFPGSDELILDGIRPYEEGNRAIWLGAQFDNWNKHNMLIAQIHSNKTSNLIVRRKNGGEMHLNNCRFFGAGLISLGPGDVSDFELDGELHLDASIRMRLPHVGADVDMIEFLDELSTASDDAVTSLTSLVDDFVSPI